MVLTTTPKQAASGSRLLEGLRSTYKKESHEYRHFLGIRNPSQHPSAQAVLHMLHMLYRVGASENSRLAYWQTGPPNISRSKENAACQRLAAAPEKTANFSSCFPGVFLLEASCSPFKANR